MSGGARGPAVWHAAIVLGWLMVPQLFTVLRPWPLYLLVPLLGYAVTVACIGPLRRSAGWFSLGRSGWDVAAATLAIIVVTSGALLLWQLLVRPDLHDLADPLRGNPYLSLAALGVVLPLLNALMEEILFRGILFAAFEANYGPWWAAVMQGLLFGFGHAQGVPRGVMGIVMASIYGVTLGWLRHFSRGLLWPFVAHIFADATIFLIVMHGAQRLSGP